MTLLILFFIKSCSGSSFPVKMMKKTSVLPFFSRISANSAFCILKPSRINLLILFRSTAFLKWRVLTLNPVCRPAHLFCCFARAFALYLRLASAGKTVGDKAYTILNGNTLNAFPDLNSSVISLRLFSRSFLPSVLAEMFISL